jgi:hypothetical protein|nr:MAG TPA: hypothetical protein [Caudoviricetes sp.]
MDGNFQNLGVLKISWNGNTITIERETPYGKKIVKNNVKQLPPRRELRETWQSLQYHLSNCIFDGDDECSNLKEVSFKVKIVDDEFGLVAIGVKGELHAKYYGEFSIPIIRDESALEACEALYKLAADYFDGKNAQLEFGDNPTSRLANSALLSGANSVEISSGKYGIKITKDGIEPLGEKGAE